MEVQTTTAGDRGELEVLAERIAGEVGASEAPRDSALVTLAKGMADAVRALTKGKKMAEDDGAGSKDNEEKDKGAKADESDSDGKDDDGKKDEDEDGASYEDMRMAKDGAAAGNGEPEFLDATEMLTGLAADIKAMRKGQEGLLVEVKALREENASLKATVSELDTASRKDVGLVMAEMAKGVLGVHDILRKTPIVPVSSISNSTLGKHRLVRESLDKLAEDTQVTPSQMAKALQKKLIGEDELRAWKAGEFNDAELLAQIKVL